MPKSGVVLQQTTGPSPISTGYCSAYTSRALMSIPTPSKTSADTMKFSTNSIPAASKKERVQGCFRCFHSCQEILC